MQDPFQDVSISGLNPLEERVSTPTNSQKLKQKHKIEDQFELEVKMIADRQEARERKKKKKVRHKQRVLNLDEDVKEDKDFDLKRIGVENPLFDNHSLRESNQTIMSSNQSLRHSKISAVKKLNQSRMKYETIEEDIIESRKKSSIPPEYGEVSVSTTKCPIKYLFRAGTAFLFLECSLLALIPLSFLLTPFLCLALIYIILPYYYMINCILLGSSSQSFKNTLAPPTQQSIILITPFRPNNQIQPINYCQYCQIYKTGKIYHCQRCSVCHIGFDHYCSWLGVCIFSRNYQMFFRFLISIFLLFLVILALDIAGIVILEPIKEQPSQTSYKTALEIILSISLVQSTFSEGFICYVLIYQIWVRSKGMTTKEYFRGDMEMPGNNLLCNSVCHQSQIIDLTQDPTDIERQWSQRRKQKFREQENSNVSILKNVENKRQRAKDKQGQKLDLIKLKPIIVEKNFIDREEGEIASNYYQEQLESGETMKPKLLANEGEFKIFQDTIDLTQSRIVKIENKPSEIIQNFSPQESE